MNKLKLLSSMLIVILLVGVNPIRTNAEWREDSNGWWNTEGNSWSVGWKEIDGNWYYFKEDGYMKTGWLLDGNKWYYLNSNGAMAYNTEIDGYKLGSDGTWIQNPQNNSSSSDSNEKNNIFTFDQFVSIIKTKFNNVQVEDTNKKGYFLSNNIARKKINIGDKFFNVYVYNNNEEMEKDALNVPSDGNGSIEYISMVHYYKKGNVIIQYVGTDQTIISVLKSILGEQFAGDK